MTTTTLRSRISGAAVCRFLGGRVVPCLNLNRPTLCCYCCCSCCRRRRGRRRGGWGPATRRQSATAHFAPLPPPLPGRPGQPRRRVGGPPRPSWPRNYAASASSSRQLQDPAPSLAAPQHRVVPDRRGAHSVRNSIFPSRTRRLSEYVHLRRTHLSSSDAHGRRWKISDERRLEETGMEETVALDRRTDGAD